MKFRGLLALTITLSVGCGETDTKLNSDPNVTPNNSLNLNNSGSNNVGNNGTAGPIVPANYDQSCTTEQDCMLILSGDACGCGPCFDAAINVSDQSKLQSDIAANMCGEIACPAVACGEDQLPHCNQSTSSCEVRVAKYTRGEDWDRACSVDEDCVAVFEGEICEECLCPNTAINVADQAAYEAQFDVACVHNSDCSCAAPMVLCNEGLCVVE